MISKKDFDALVQKGLNGSLSEKEQASVDEYQHEYRSRAVDAFMKEFVWPVLPNASTGMISSFGNPWMTHTHARVDGLLRQCEFKGSPYYFPVGPDTRLVHYTSIQGVLGILREGALRLYSLSHSDDPNEFTHMAGPSGFAGDELRRYKDRLMTISMVDISNDGAQEELDHWRTYGSDGRGVGIVFSIEPASDDEWMDYHLGRIAYGEEEAQWLRNLPERLRAFQERKCFHVQDAHKLFVKPFALHKHGIFHRENEVRLLHYVKHNGVVGYKDQKDLFPDLNRYGKPSWFHRLRLGKAQYDDEAPLNDNDLTVTIRKMIPRLKIERIIVGYHNSPMQFDHLHLTSILLASRSLGYVVPVEKSRFTDYFQNVVQ